MVMYQWQYTYLYFLKRSSLLSSMVTVCNYVAGDGRCDSPGSSAKYCSYSLMEMNSYKILHVETMDKREVDLQSPSTEHQAFLHSMSYIKGKVTCDELVTNGSSSICK